MYVFARFFWEGVKVRLCHPPLPCAGSEVKFAFFERLSFYFCPAGFDSLLARVVNDIEKRGYQNGFPSPRNVDESYALAIKRRRICF